MTASMKGRCPTCRGVALKAGNKLWPFCSERCHLVDLGRWLGEEYRIPAEEADAQGGGIESVTPQSDDDR
ncbi:MAG TPA: DNA gyrase inhibitor YacG [Kofleriaceae bacterium]|jgi:uncharacterized protein|nr:DNA gyrase inhibitor YacG [Kofleriaceae bacterium]